LSNKDEKLAIIRTERLLLRPWLEKDLDPFTDLNSDPRVREYFPSLLTKEESAREMNLAQTEIEEKGWGFWAAALLSTGEFIGMIGLHAVSKEKLSAHFTPAIEIGWRLAYDHWGKGYATEGAKAALAYGFSNVNLDEIVAFTALQNQRSRHVMEKIGMLHNPKDDFKHPKLTDGHRLQYHVLYRIKKELWQSYGS
jgi:3-dehydroquinate dehydratase/shikimate dehydrogenase